MTEPKEPTISTDTEYLLRHYGTCWCRKCETIRALLAEREASEWECEWLRAKLDAVNAAYSALLTHHLKDQAKDPEP